MDTVRPAHYELLPKKMPGICLKDCYWGRVCKSSTDQLILFPLISQPREQRVRSGCGPFLVLTADKNRLPQASMRIQSSVRCQILPYHITMHWLLSEQIHI